MIYLLFIHNSLELAVSYAEVQLNYVMLCNN